jgi:hypothetical protein
VSLSATDKASVGWDQSISKFLAFNETDYLRIIHLDNDITLNKHLDDLFLLPSAPVAMPRAYWAQQSPLPSLDSTIQTPIAQKDIPPLSPHLIVIEPSMLETARIFAALEAESNSPDNTSLDVVILNRLYNNTALILPHRRYSLRTGEFRRQLDDHMVYLGTSSMPITPTEGSDSTLNIPIEKWNSERMLREASVVHFAGDEPLPKPWIMWPLNLYKETRPKCGYMDGTKLEADCHEREVWEGIYNNFRERRKEVCGLLSVPASEWRPPKVATTKSSTATSSTLSATQKSTV